MSVETGQTPVPGPQPGPAEEDFSDLFDDETEPEATPEQITEAVKELKERCDRAKIAVEEFADIDGDTAYEVLMPSGREKRRIALFGYNDLRELLAIPFEKYTFLSGYEAICSYSDGIVEASLRPIGTFGLSFLDNWLRADAGAEREYKQLCFESTDAERPRITLGRQSAALDALISRGTRPVSFMLTNVRVTQHDHAVELLQRYSNAVFFQLDLVFGLGIGLRRERAALRPAARRRLRRDTDLAAQLQYPTAEYDSAPISLYWYARNASGMPLLQFLAFYQVVEFYFPTYSQLEARRRIRSILKDPSFRNDRDADLGRLLTTIQLSRSGAYGDERSQLHATMTECVDAHELRRFLTSDDAKKQFFSSKTRGITDRKLPIGNETADLRNEAADRIYDIRCRIVHTKAEGGDGAFELLLPFSREAEQLTFDVELVQFVAQKVLISASSPLSN